MASCLGTSNRSVRAMKDGQVAAEGNQIVSPVPSFHADSNIDGSIGNNSPVKASDNDASRPSLKVVIDKDKLIQPTTKVQIDLTAEQK